MLHGVIDLLYQDPQGEWYILDWKTEWAPQELIEENSQQHLMQMAAYAQATNNRLDGMPDVALCFLSPRAAVHQFLAEEIASAWLEVAEQH